ncbi:hypothetical protein CH249_14730 [Rhodococcus sp. 05-2255-3B1]|uniref:hypothetical protein n=1 Tax=unclassified Rhodococcus (in: high G+C Gram-positive bacteria) TaxID=192944 RepID=UPI000B9C649A|nr:MULTISPECIES: hypothetical protein [unclassified Rhodococcus (in: high G+C Gram-positive bacteria)]OZE03069.1 hypothetical protein CH250_22795 [Rhodococcus sp. 05-2255-3C]OZE09459.1 hypothetical protein CH249_14730 [Rhodococcus sp. 05-2255-3B1]
MSETIIGGPHDGAAFWRKYEFTITDSGIGLSADVPDGSDDQTTGWTFARDAAMAVALIMDSAGKPELCRQAKALVEAIHADSEVVR